MKKLLLGAITALTFLFGFASCSDDIHNVTSPNVLYIGGGLAATENEVNTEKWELIKVADPLNGTDAYKVEVNDDGTFELEFKYGKDEWGDPANSDYTSKLSLLITAVDMSKTGITWDDDINKQRWKSDGEIVLNEDAKELVSGADNVILSGLSIGNTYTIKGTVDGDKISMQVSQKFDPLNFYVIAEGESKNFPAADKDGKDILYLMTGSSQKYSYQFIATANETFKITAFNGITGDSDVSDALTVTQDMGYKIEYEIGKKPTLSTLSMLVDAEVISNTGHDYDFYQETNLSNNSIILISTRSEFQFYINRTAGDSSLGWGSGEDIPFSLDFSPVTLDYTKRSGEPKPITVKKLTPGKVYMLTFKEDGINVKLEKIIEASALPTTIAGSWWSPDDINLDWKIEGEDATATVEAKLSDDYTDGWNNKNSSTVSFALLKTPGNWDDGFWKDVNFKFGDTKELKQGGNNNNVITNTAGSLAGKTIKLVFTGKFDETKGEVSKISCTATAE